jgi:hypothetical protein
MLHDYKVTDPGAHRRWTGTDNARILDNFRKAYTEFPDINYIARIPLVPGVNDDEAHIDAVLDRVLPYACVSELELLPYHRFGDSSAGCMRWKTLPRRQSNGCSSCVSVLSFALHSDGHKKWRAQTGRARFNDQNLQLGVKSQTPRKDCQAAVDPEKSPTTVAAIHRLSAPAPRRGAEPP